MKKKNLSAKKKIHSFYFEKLEDTKIKNIYLDFKKNLSSHISGNFCVAVSGGVDSMALTFLSKCYSLEENKRVYFFIVDHKLRKDSSSEANIVKSKLKKFKIDCQTLTIKKKIKFSNLQSFARDNRYKLIFKQSLKKKICNILTAHHSDDLLENFFIRLLRGSGLKGLTSFSKVKTKIKFDDQTFILRPLINVSKKDLKYISKKTFNFYVNDPSNQSDKFLRSRLRKLISKLENEGLTFSKFKKSINSLTQSNFAIDYYVQKNINNNSSYLRLSNSIILNDSFFKQPSEIVFRSFSEIIKKVGKRDTYARGSKIENLIHQLFSTNQDKKKTLSGCIIRKFQKSVIISQEK